LDDLRPALGASVHIPTDAEADELLAVCTVSKQSLPGLPRGARRQNTGTSTVKFFEAIGGVNGRRAGDPMRRHTERTRQISHEPRQETAVAEA
jgi:hypothetical protein